MKNIEDVIKENGTAIKLGGNLFDTKRVGEAKEIICEAHGAYDSQLLVVLNRNEIWRKCPRCKEDEAELKAKKQAEEEALEKKRQVERELNRSCIPMRFQGKTLDNYQVLQAEQNYIVLAAKTIVSDFEVYQKNGLQLVLAGRVGTGKSHIAIAIAQAVMLNKKTAFYTTVIDLIRMVRNTWQKGSEKTELQVIKSLVSIDLLIIDEVGVQYGTDAERITLFDVIDKRYREMKPTIYLTNLDKKAMKAFLGERSFDRIREGGMWVDFTWESYRSSSREAERK